MIHCNTLLTVGAATVDLKIRRHTEAQERNRYLPRREQKTGSHLVRVIKLDGCAVFVVAQVGTEKVKL